MRKSYSTRLCIYLKEITLALVRNVNVMLMYQVFIYYVVCVARRSDVCVEFKVYNFLFLTLFKKY